MYYPGDLHTKSLGLLRYRTRCSGPIEQIFGLVVGHHVLIAFSDRLFDAGKAASADRPLGDDPKPALYSVEPGGVRGHVMDVEAGALCCAGCSRGSRP